MEEEIYAPFEINLENAEAIWKRIVQMEGEIFYTVRRKMFKYSVKGNGIQVIGNKPYNLSKGNFVKAIPSFSTVGLSSLPKNKLSGDHTFGGFLHRISNGN
jgi:hypothetical protein